ncbi:hypothetical protein CDAR_41001 [Caerostris darwini]|uniref:SpoVT-AbrB domain-containing protein n=1 Tax=Caerostris darwini TaxID=1538125 RepID=A0AAV4VG56_9ARAC|nr:hypothetical protein CDAR_41001 [Caerostris darwini]
MCSMRIFFQEVVLSNLQNTFTIQGCWTIVAGDAGMQKFLRAHESEHGRVTLPKKVAPPPSEHFLEEGGCLRASLSSDGFPHPRERGG